MVHPFRRKVTSKCLPVLSHVVLELLCGFVCGLGNIPSISLFSRLETKQDSYGFSPPSIFYQYLPRRTYLLTSLHNIPSLKEVRHTRRKACHILSNPLHSYWVFNIVYEVSVPSDSLEELCYAGVPSKEIGRASCRESVYIVIW